MKKIFKIILGVVVFCVVVFFGLAAAGFWRKGEMQKTADAVLRIESRKITLADVMGENLPPKPDQVANDSTVAGIDANNNAIRDDVELAIFQKYPNSARIRAAMLQYAQALQLELTEVFNSETLVATLQKEDLAYGCINKVDGSLADKLQDEMNNLVLNTDLRKRAREKSFEYLIGHGYKNSQKCDIDLSALIN